MILIGADASNADSSSAGSGWPATVSTWFKKPGDVVKQDEMLCELETDKVSVEVPAPASGVLAEILAPEGTTVDAKARLAIDIDPYSFV